MSTHRSKKPPSFYALWQVGDDFDSLDKSLGDFFESYLAAGHSVDPRRVHLQWQKVKNCRDALKLSIAKAAVQLLKDAGYVIAPGAVSQANSRMGKDNEDLDTFSAKLQKLEAWALSPLAKLGIRF